MAIRDYDGDGIRVHWDSSKCIHTAICLRSLPDVFDVDSRPWIDTSAADTAAIAATVESCPSGALSYARTDGEPDELPEETTTITAIQNGPLSIRGRVRLQTLDGQTIAEHSRVTLCRCGASRNQPFCDSSHRTVEFETTPPGVPPERDLAASPGQVCSVQITPYR